MGMKFIKKIFEDSGLKDAQFAYKIGTSQERVRKMLGKTATTLGKSQTKLDFHTLMRIYKLSKLSKSAFMDLLIEEFGDDD